jgi:hypothetical protein
MGKVVVSTDDVIDAFCRMLEPGIKKNALPKQDCNKYGVDVLYKKSDPYQIMFHFVTLENFEVNLVLDLMELQKRGKEYLDHLYGLLCDQTEQARKVKQENGRVDIQLPPMKKSAAAHNEAFH